MLKLYYKFNFATEPKILNPAIAEINLEIDDMDLSLFQARRGREVVQVEIHNNFIRNPRF
nr:hypothetical protein [Staphylococcus epidermidis]